MVLLCYMVVLLEYGEFLSLYLAVTSSINVRQSIISKLTIYPLFFFAAW